MECQYTLMTFGIPKMILPINGDGSVNDFVVRQWKQWLEQDQSCGNQDRSVTIQVPGPMDVIMGRGRHGQSSPGNLRFKHVVAEHQEQYETSKQFGGKVAVAEEVLRKLRELGCRFVKPNKGSTGWAEVDDDAVKLKITHAFRNLRTTVSSSNASKTKSRADAALGMKRKPEYELDSIPSHGEFHGKFLAM